MTDFFIRIYHWTDRHKSVFYTLLAMLTCLCVVPASRIKLDRNISGFFGNADSVLTGLSATDKIIITIEGDDPDSMSAAGDRLISLLRKHAVPEKLASISYGLDENALLRYTEWFYAHIPIFLADSDYSRISEQLSDEGIMQVVDMCYRTLSSPGGLVLGDFVTTDPFGIGRGLADKLDNLNPNEGYVIHNGRIFTNNLKCMLIFADPVSGMSDIGSNSKTVKLIDEAIESVSDKNVRINCTGAPVIAVHNAWRIKKDAATTLSIALLLIIGVTFFYFKDIKAIPLIIIPPAFGMLAAIAAMAIFKGSISEIAAGAGTVVLGISLSYSIHVVAHSLHERKPEKIISELAVPLVTGCATTIGAFIALLFTDSALLQDFGLISALSLAGTTLFCLIVLPHFPIGSAYPGKTKPGKIIGKITGYPLENKKWLIGAIIATTLLCIPFYNKAGFDGDMSGINYMPEDIAEATKTAAPFMEGDGALIISGNPHIDSILSSLAQQKAIDSYSGINDIIIDWNTQISRIGKWEQFWKEKGSYALNTLKYYASEAGFADDAFNGFERLISRKYIPVDYSNEEFTELPFAKEWVSISGQTIATVNKIKLKEENKDIVYDILGSYDGVTVMDRDFFSEKMIEDISGNFNYILTVSSALVFIMLLISYRRIELTLLSFLPMCISWVIILGIMGIFGMKFNIVNIILATFIFGIGDDFSIFIMDGMIRKYRNGEKILGAHKTAILFSAFTTITGLGVLIFARHPALKSISLISVLGLCTVILVSFTIQPFLFKLLISSPAERGGRPYSVAGLLNSAFSFLYFLAGCIIAHIVAIVLYAAPLKVERKKSAFHWLIYAFNRVFIHTMITVRAIKLNPHRENFRKPAVIIANHQSITDILLLLSFSPKIVIITNTWARMSPFIGMIIRYADFYHAGGGYDKLAEKLEPLTAKGYSVVIYPEGTRSKDNAILRFHKGAFYLAQRLKLDILPIVIYGTGHICSKTQSAYIKKGLVVGRIMKRIEYGKSSCFGRTYQEQSREYRKWFIWQTSVMHRVFGLPDPYYRDALIKNYLFKGNDIIRAVRSECRRFGFYGKLHEIIPGNATVADFGCGYGQSSFMLAMLSPERKITGIDCTEECIETAKHCFLYKKGHNVNFITTSADMSSLPEFDVIILNTGIEKITEAVIENTVMQIAEKLRPGGLVLLPAENSPGSGIAGKLCRKYNLNIKYYGKI